MTDDPAQRRRTRDKLGFQLAFILAAVLLPLTFISVAKSVAVTREAAARSEAALVGETMRNVAAQLRLIQEARATAATLADRVVPLLDDPAACSAALAGLIRRQPQYSLIAYVRRDGLMQCSTYGQEMDFSQSPIFIRVMDEAAPAIFLNPAGLSVNTPILGFSHPVYDGAERLVGLVSLSLPLSEFSAADTGDDAEMPADMVYFDGTGAVLGDPDAPDRQSVLPGDRALSALTSPVPMSFSAVAKDGRARVYSVVPLVVDQLYALGARPAAPGTILAGPFSAPFLLPALMWLASLTVAWLAVERLVTRHVRKLSASITSFAGGNRVVGDIAVENAPLEIREMAAAYEAMTENILREEARLEYFAHQKAVLLSELHHRVKNNLQLIASIMNMQTRRVQSAESKQMLIELRNRVMSLATIHRELFETAGRADIHADEMLASIVRQITGAAMKPGHTFDVTTGFDDIRMIPDQAVPLGLFVAEALTNAIKHGGGENLRIDVSLRRKGDSGAELRVVNSTAPDKSGALRTGLGTQLITAFAAQLGGQVERAPGNGEYRLAITFDIKPLSAAELREDGQDAADGP
ncbi:MAG: sensor histidine kinase [Paracoccaceae bacterium]